MRRKAVTIAALVLSAVAVAGCSSDTAVERSARSAGPEAQSDGVDPDLVRTDVDCDEQGLGSTDELEFVTAHYVVDGVLGARCFGDDDPTLVVAWEELEAISPEDERSELALFAGVVSNEGGDEETLAFVNALDDDGTAFQMSVNLDAFDADPDEAKLTMAHEFSHVFTLVPGELDWSVDDEEDCATFHNGDGCLVAGSLLLGWMDRFWSESDLDDIDPDVEPSVEDGETRCELDGSFWGSYAAASPEEDFAEAFSAFVYRVEPATPGQQAKIDWLAGQPGLAEFRDRAIESGRGPLENSFDSCGT